MLLEGLFLPIATPFYPDGRLNLRKIEHNVDRYSRTPAAGLAVLSDVGEPEMLTDAETREALTSAISLAVDTKVMLAGVSRASVFATLELVEHAAAVGYDAVLIKRPGASVERPQELLTYFQAIADRSPLPIVLYSTRLEAMPVEAIAALASHPRIIGLVDEDSAVNRITQLQAATVSLRHDVTVTTVFAAVTGRMLAVKEAAGAATFVSAEMLGAGAAVATAPPKPAIKTRTKPVGFQIITASSTGMLDGLRAGAVGAMPAFAASAPQASYEVYAAWKDGDQALADVKQARLASAIEVVEQRFGLAGVRYASELTGYFGGRPRLPVLPLSGDAREAVERVMKGIRN
ncbi:MAG: dihydrodipicolinate synthase family protein [Edaphobacter sp.]|uniref:dihydrodipicolinate synthase family protein n=1 Tax=Edaphobacter sp. TaxID=1934404 RepID=UPI00238E676C|nr:dihydrodipicolinate synthase family protein [Edaphobacter sp.]MDE1178410.1 dihydrodipicolinate synthase family protein [Edaphobacter sp.]